VDRKEGIRRRVEDADVRARLARDRAEQAGRQAGKEPPGSPGQKTHQEEKAVHERAARVQQQAAAQQRKHLEHQAKHDEHNRPPQPKKNRAE
jgi:hypothetical protein